MTLRKKQSLFAYLLALLIIEANRQGYELTLGEAYRSPQEARRLYDLYKAGKGPRASLNSIHCIKLAQDLNLFKNDVYLKTTRAHLPLGEFWEALNPLCRWGGRFGDGNHYSLEHQGYK